jgi:hypothetical protein
MGHMDVLCCVVLTHEMQMSHGVAKYPVSNIERLDVIGSAGHCDFEFFKCKNLFICQEWWMNLLDSKCTSTLAGEANAR